MRTEFAARGQEAFQADWRGITSRSILVKSIESRSYLF